MDRFGAEGIALFCAKLPGLLVLKMLLEEGVLVKYVVTASGNHDKDINLVAKQSGIPVFCDIDLRLQETKESLFSFQAFAGLSVSYSKKIPADVLSSFPGCGFNFHPARLPSYRGCLPTVWPILEGDKFAEYTMIVMDRDFDTGPVVDVEKIIVDPQETGWSFYQKMVACLPALVKRNLSGVLNSGVTGVKQTEIGAKYYSQDLPNDGFLDWGWPCMKIERFIRALFHPTLPCAKAMINNAQIEIPSAKIYSQRFCQMSPGDLILDARGMVVACGDGFILTENIQFDGQAISMVGLKEMPPILR
jgi:methionyl-tRNA formyltransferase